MTFFRIPKHFKVNFSKLNSGFQFQSFATSSSIDFGPAVGYFFVVDRLYNEFKNQRIYFNFDALKSSGLKLTRLQNYS
jgi:hypothetical protein